MSHSRTEAEIISSDASRLEEIPALYLWYMVIDVLESLVGSDPMRNIKPKEDEIYHGGQEDNRQFWRCSSELLHLQPKRIKTIIKCWSPSMRHISRTHRVNPDWLFHRINLDPGIQIKYVNTSKRIADIRTAAVLLVFPSVQRDNKMSKRLSEPITESVTTTQMPVRKIYALTAITQ